MEKKGQVTIFVILAIVLIAAISLYFGFRNKNTSENIPPAVEPIYTHIISCLQKTSKEGAEYIGEQGGYYELPKAISIEYFSKDIPYYYLNSKENIPSLERIELELGNYIYYNLERCIDFEYFEEQGYEISGNKLLVSPIIREKGVDINVEYPITITKGTSTERLENFEVFIEADIKKMIEVSKDIVDCYYELPKFICLTCLEEISDRYYVKIVSTSFSSNNEEAILFSITSYETELNWIIAMQI